jgi:hypothetical protein
MLSMSHIHPHPTTFQASPVFEVDFNRSGSDYNTKDDSQFIPPRAITNNECEDHLLFAQVNHVTSGNLSHFTAIIFDHDIDHPTQPLLTFFDDDRVVRARLGLKTTSFH